MPKRNTPEATGLLAERTKNGRRSIKLTKRERQTLSRQRLATAAAALFLDLDQPRTYKQISEDLEISIHSLKELIKSTEFDEAYNNLMFDLGHDPRYKAARAAIGDMLPQAVAQLQAMIDSPRTAAGVRLRAIEKVFELNGLDEPTVQSDRNEIVEFLLANKVDIKEVNITIPPEFIDHMGPDVIDADSIDIVDPAALSDKP